MINKNSVRPHIRRSTAFPRRRNTPTNPCAKIIAPVKLSAAVITDGPSSPSSGSESVLPRSPTKHRSAQDVKRHSELGHQARLTPTTTELQQRDDGSPDDFYADGPIEIFPGIYIGPEDEEGMIVLKPDGADSQTVSDRPSLPSAEEEKRAGRSTLENNASDVGVGDDAPSAMIPTPSANDLAENPSIDESAPRLASVKPHDTAKISASESGMPFSRPCQSYTKD